MTEATSIRPALQRASAALNLDINRMQAVAQLRRVARDIAHTLYGVTSETAETVALQNSMQNALDKYCDAMKSPVAAASYIAPDAVRGVIAAQSPAANVDLSEQQANGE